METLAPTIEAVLRQVLQVRSTLHGAGSVSAQALSAIARHASTQRILHSAETGCGATTLLLSHLSQNHAVFALNAGDSLSSVRRSALLRREVVTFIEGPSQRTLPRHHFSEKLQLALIDGPHAFPFPDLEYYFLYPHLEPGALLILDDIQIRSIHNLFEFLRSDAMFRLDEVVRSTAFFTRTDAPTFDPAGDGWEQQGYNARSLIRYDWRSKVKGALPRSAIRRLEAFRSSPRSGCSVEIHRADQGGLIEGSAKLAVDEHLWILVHRKDVNGWWPQGGGEIAVTDSRWSVKVQYGGSEDAGYDFEIAAVIVSGSVHEHWLGSYPPVQLPRPPAVRAQDYRTVTKR